MIIYFDVKWLLCGYAAANLRFGLASYLLTFWFVTLFPLFQFCYPFFLRRRLYQKLPNIGQLLGLSYSAEVGGDMENEV